MERNRSRTGNSRGAVFVRLQVESGSGRQPPNLRALGSGEKSNRKQRGNIENARHIIRLREDQRMPLECHETGLEQNLSDMSLHEGEILQFQLVRRSAETEKSQQTGEQRLTPLKASYLFCKALSALTRGAVSRRFS